jgi:aspartate racemase
MEKRVIGIVGGMGPQAGLALFDSVIRCTNAVTDQQHIPVIMISFPGKIADRTMFLEGAGVVNPAFSIAAVIRQLETAGAEVVGIACNTAYSPRIYNVILSELDKVGSGVKLAHMPSETCRFIRETYPSVRRIGIMSTNGTYRSRIYEDTLKEQGYDVIVPDAEFQENVIHRMIYDPDFGIKANPDRISDEVQLLKEQALDYFRMRNAQALLLGCTELSLLEKELKCQDLIVIDSCEGLARGLIREATLIRHSRSALNSVA